ncbi:MAG: hypothetical protein AB7F43_13515 [Bacteriovoracia bacterium]
MESVEKKDLTSLVELSQRELANNPSPEQTNSSDEHAVPQGNFLNVTPLASDGNPLPNDPENPLINDLSNPIEPTPVVEPSLDQPLEANDQAIQTQASQQLEQQPLELNNPQEELPSLQNDFLQTSSETEQDVTADPLQDPSLDSFDLQNATVAPEPVLENVEASNELTRNTNSAIEPDLSMNTMGAAAPLDNQGHQPTSSSLTKATPHDLSKVKQALEKAAIGHPRVEANPAYHLRAQFPKHGPERARAIERIEEALSSDDFGVLFQDVMIQLEAGKLFVPSISEFAAIELAQKLRDVVDDLEITEGSNQDRLNDSSIYTTPHQQKDARDLDLEPIRPEDVLISNLDQVEGYKIARRITVLSAITPIAFEEEAATQSQDLLVNLRKQAVHYRANGLIGVSFNVKSTTPPKQDMRGRLVLVATATAVQLMEDLKP